jgi:hypothetical protein
MGSMIMADLKIRVFKGKDTQPATTVTILGGVLKIARNLVPQRALGALRDEGIDVDEIVRLSEGPEAKGKLVEIEDHGKDERVVISLE